MKLQRIFIQLLFMSTLSLAFTACSTKRNTPQDVAKQLIANYASFQPGRSATLFLDQVNLARIAEEIKQAPRYFQKKRAESKESYRNRLKSWLIKQQRSFKIAWKEVKFDKIIEEKPTYYGITLGLIPLKVLFKKGDVTFQQSITLIKYCDYFYIWELGAFDRYRGGNKVVLQNQSLLQ